MIAHSTAEAGASGSARTRRDNRMASGSWFLKASDAAQSPSRKRVSDGWLTRDRSSFNTWSAVSASPIDHCRLAMRAAPTVSARVR